MTKRLAKWLLRLSGWTMREDVPPETERCVIIAAPHTSNWDLWYARLGFYVVDIPLRFTIKQEWSEMPILGWLIRSLGAIGIDRKPKVSGGRQSYVEAMADLFKEYERLAVMVTPEGSRSLRKQWKTGFYYTALTAGVPICLGYLDYGKKEAGVGEPVYPSGNLEQDMRKIMAFYQNITGRNPSLFSVDERYA